MNILPKLCAVIAGHNVIPLLGDKGKGRLYELRVLCALVAGTERLSLRHLIISNVWESRNSYDRCFIPHCRLITHLMRVQGCVGNNIYHVHKTHRLLSLNGIDKKDWRYTLNNTHHVLKDRVTGQSLKGQRDDVPPIDEIEEEMEDVEDEVEESEESDGDEIDRKMGQYKKEIEVLVVKRRRPEYNSWERHVQMMWDRNTRHQESQRRMMKDLIERQDQHALAQAWMIQEDINARHIDAEKRKEYEEWYAGRTFVPNPGPIPWEQLPSYQGGKAPYPVPKTHSSRWIPLQQPRHSTNLVDSEGTLKEVKAMMREYFRDEVPLPPYDRQYGPDDYQPGGPSGTLDHTCALIRSMCLFSHLLFLHGLILYVWLRELFVLCFAYFICFGVFRLWWC
ncbi:hypothetical protein Hanom_Chr07g00590071 [Helianthus anomalus]